MLSQSLRASRQAIARMSRPSSIAGRRTYFVPTAFRSADLVQDMYLRELKNYKSPPVKPNDADSYVHKFSVPQAPKSPEEGDIASELKAYENQQPEIEGQAPADAAANPAEEDWLEAEEEEEAHAAH